MKRFVNPVPQFFDNSGNILSGGFVNFYENGSTTTRKHTYNANNGAQNLNPLPLADSGRIPPCWGDGLYTVVVTDADGVQIWQRNDVEFDSSDGQFSDFSSVKNYAINDIVRYTNGKYYISESNNNIGNDPEIILTKWSEVSFIKFWNTDKPGGYSTSDIVVYNGRLYRSQSDSNTGTPGVSGWDDLTFNNAIVGNFSVTQDITCRSITADTNTLHVDYTNNRVGIGTTTPSKPLDVVGDINSSGLITSLGLTVDTNVLHVDSTNNRVGIGTTTPSVPLNVIGAITASGVITGNGFVSSDSMSIANNLTVGGSVTSSHWGVARRNSTLSITTDTVLDKDPSLTVSGLATGFYQVSGIIVFNTNSGGAANGLKITMDADASTNLQTIVWQRFTATTAVDALTSTTPVFESASGSDNYIIFNGTIRLDSGSDLAIWVSQNVSSATAVQIKSGSSLIARRVGDA